MSGRDLDTTILSGEWPLSHLKSRWCVPDQIPWVLIGALIYVRITTATTPIRGHWAGYKFSGLLIDHYPPNIRCHDPNGVQHGVGGRWDKTALFPKRLRRVRRASPASWSWSASIRRDSIRRESRSEFSTDLSTLEGSVSGRLQGKGLQSAINSSMLLISLNYAISP